MFSINPPQINVECSWNSSFWETRIYSSCIVNTIVVDILAMPGAGVSAGMVLTCVSYIMLGSKPEGPNWADDSQRQWVKVMKLLQTQATARFDLLDLGRCSNNSKRIISKLIILNRHLGTLCKIALRYMSQNLTNEKLMLVQVMAWCHQATSHYLNQYWPRSMASLGHNKLGSPFQC